MAQRTRRGHACGVARFLCALALTAGMLAVLSIANVIDPTSTLAFFGRPFIIGAALWIALGMALVTRFRSRGARLATVLVSGLMAFAWLAAGVLDYLGDLFTGV